MRIQMVRTRLIGGACSCYVCLKPLKHDAKTGEVVLEDDNHQHVEVGADCFANVVKAGYDGVRSGKGKGPMVFATTEMAMAYARRKVCTCGAPIDNTKCEAHS